MLAACAHRAPEAPVARDPVREARDAALEQDRDQILDLLRLASLAHAGGQEDVAERALRDAVPRIQDFQADGELAAFVVSESSKEWKGEPYEKMMAFLQLGWLLLADGDAGNALAMAKSAVLADSGSRQEKWGSDLVSAWVLQSLAYRAMGDADDADKALERAVDAVWIRALADELAQRLRDVDAGSGGEAEAAARALLLAGLPVGLSARPRDPVAAVDAALSWATDARMVALDGPRKTWPDGIGGLEKDAVRGAFDDLGPLAAAWKQAAALDRAALEPIAADEAALRAMAGSSLVLVVESGTAPVKLATGRYGEALQIVQGDPGEMPYVTLDGQPDRPALLDSVSWQATTRGGRRVDAFLRGKAMFKDAAPALGWLLVVAGDVANASNRRDQDDTLSTVLFLAGGAVWVAGALANPAADTRTWDLLPDAVWLVAADPAPGIHQLVVGDRTYTVDVPDAGMVVQWIPALAPGGADRFGDPCEQCSPPLAIPAKNPPEKR